MQLLIDESFAEKVIPADDSVRLLDRIVEEMDLSKLERAYDVRGRKSAIEPSIIPCSISASWEPPIITYNWNLPNVFLCSSIITYNNFCITTASLNIPFT